MGLRSRDLRRPLFPYIPSCTCAPTPHSQVCQPKKTLIYPIRIWVSHMVYSNPSLMQTGNPTHLRPALMFALHNKSTATCTPCHLCPWSQGEPLGLYNDIGQDTCTSYRAARLRHAPATARRGPHRRAHSPCAPFDVCFRVFRVLGFTRRAPSGSA